MSILSAKFRLAIVPLSILLAYSANSQAQQNPTEDVDKNPTPQSKPAKPERPAKPATEKLQEVEISGAKGYDERRQDTASKIVVTQEDIIRYGDTNISDVLKRLPGVTIGGVQGRGGSIRMRGLGSGYTMVMLNGEPSPPGFSLDSISPDIVERIEVIRSGTAEHSTQAIAGAINIVLKKAIQTAQRELKIGAQEDGGKVGGNVSVQLADKLGRMSYSVSGNLNRGSYDRPSYYDETGTDAAGAINRHGDVRDWGTYTSVGMAPRINWNLQNGDTITSQSFVNGSRFSGFNTENTNTQLGKAPLYASSLTDIDSNSAMLRSNLNWIHKLADSAKLDFKLGANFNQRSSDVIFSAFNPGGKQILDRQVSSDSSDKGLTYSGKYSAPFFEDHDFVAGWDGAYSNRSENRSQLDHVLDTTSGLSPADFNDDFSAGVTRLALFAQDEWKASKNWSFYAGLRWEGLETRSSGNSYAEIRNRSSVWSPILQTLWKLPNSKNDQVRLGLTRTYKAPDTNKLIPRRISSDGNNSATNPGSTGNPNLKPELAWGLDAAFEHYLDGGGSLSASVFLRRIEDITRTDLSEVNGTWISMPVNAGIATTRGIEFDGKFALRSLMKEAPAIDFRGNLSFNWSDLQTVPGPNNRLDSQTPISANLGIDYKLDRIPLTIGGNYSFQNGGPVRISFNQSTYSVPKRQLDLYGLWKFDRQTSLRVSLSNTLKQDNISASTYSDTSGSLSRTTTTPTTAAIRAMLEYKF